jgi:RNA recognition motif-containing protein
MGSKLYVGNLSYGTTSQDLNTLFAAHGNVTSAEVLQDRETGRSKGFGFVQMSTDEEAAAAIAALGGKEHDGRALTVNEARPREDRPRSGGGGGGGGGYRSGGSSGGGGYSSAPASKGYVERGNTGGRSGGSNERDGNRRSSY